MDPSPSSLTVSFPPGVGRHLPPTLTSSALMSAFPQETLGRDLLLFLPARHWVLQGPELHASLLYSSPFLETDCLHQLCSLWSRRRWPQEGFKSLQVGQEPGEGWRAVLRPGSGKPRGNPPLGCALQACNACTWPTLNKSPESVRDISGLMEGGAYLSEARSWSNTPVCAAEGKQDMAAVFSLRGDCRLWGELISGEFISYQGNQQRGTPLPTPLMRTITSWGLGQVLRKVSWGVGLGCRGSRHWSIRGWTESKRAAILSGMTTCPLSAHRAPPFPRGILALILNFLLYVLSEPG